MAQLVEYHGARGTVLIEVDDAGETTSGGSLEDIARTISDIAGAVDAQLGQDGRPSADVEMTFAVKVTGDGRSAVALDGGSAHFRVRLTWAALPEGLDMPPRSG